MYVVMFVCVKNRECASESEDDGCLGRKKIRVGRAMSEEARGEGQDVCSQVVT